jgi:pimeloyl-ACP methyl ester carboxylesterase
MTLRGALSETAGDAKMTGSIAAAAAKAPVVAEDFLVPSDTADILLHVRNKRMASTHAVSPERAIVMVHGATYSSGSLFDVPLGGFSFMDYLAARGFDVYALDVRGYGGSTRPPEMEGEPERNPPIGRTDIGVRDLHSAVEFVLKKLNIAKLNILAMSWGGSVAGAYTSRNNDKVVKLALVAPLWLSATPLPLDPGGRLGAYRYVPVSETRKRWLSAAPEDKRDDLIPHGWFDAWAEASLATDPAAAAKKPRTMRAVNGPLIDVREYWNAGKSLYRPQDITVPVLLTHAEWDIDTPIDVPQSLFLSLTGAPYRRWVEIGEGTHMVLLEKNRVQAFEAIADFLEENFAPAGADSAIGSGQRATPRAAVSRRTS